MFSWANLYNAFRNYSINQKCDIIGNKCFGPMDVIGDFLLFFDPCNARRWRLRFGDLVTWLELIIISHPEWGAHNSSITTTVGRMRCIRNLLYCPFICSLVHIIKNHSACAFHDVSRSFHNSYWVIFVYIIVVFALWRPGMSGLYIDHPFCYSIYTYVTVIRLITGMSNTS